MKKNVLLVVVIVLISTKTASACDVCGSGAGGGYMGLLPGFTKMFVSVRYSNNGLVSHIGPGGTSTYLTSNERFHVTELWGAVGIGKRFRITSFIPINSMVRSNGTGISKQTGIGDASFIGYYQLLNKERTTKNEKQFEQSIWTGLGAKLPTGVYNPSEKNISDGAQNSFQLGTGSIDATASVVYDVRVDKTGINTTVSYRLTSANTYGYKYGNKFTANVLAYHQIALSKGGAFVPNAGLLFEMSKKDQKVKGLEVWETGGYSAMSTIGLEYSYKRIGFGMNYQTAIAQNLGEGKLKAKDRAMAYVSFSF